MSSSRAPSAVCFGSAGALQAMLTEESLELALLELTIEAAWDTREAALRTAQTRRQRQAARELEMDTVITAMHGVRSRKGEEVLMGRIVLLQYGMEMAEFEEGCAAGRGF